jgi:ElaB/YqjD/DUF883 family membrane-anchored ribosome-binding protein
MNTTVDALKSDLKQDVRNVVHDTELLLKAAARNGDDGMAELRNRLESQLRRLRMQVGDLEASTISRARAAAHSADQAVRAHPYGIISFAAVAGLLVGFLAARR